MKAAGFRVWFDRPNIDSGEVIVTAIEQGLERSRVLVLCMTKAAFESEWLRLERNTATLRRLKCLNWQAEYLVELLAL